MKRSAFYSFIAKKEHFFLFYVCCISLTDMVIYLRTIIHKKESSIYRKTRRMDIMKKLIALLLLAGILILNSCTPQLKGTDKDTETTKSPTIDTTERPNESYLTSTNIYTTESEHTLLLADSDIYIGSLIHISENHPQKADMDKLLQTIYKNTNNQYKLATVNMALQKEALAQFNKMTERLNKEKKFTDLLLYKAFMTEPVIESTSEYASGLTLKLKIYQDQKVYLLSQFAYIYNWLTENCHEYGFIQRYPKGKADKTGSEENDVFRYVGVPHAKYMKENNLCFEEYLALLYTHSIWKPLKYETGKDVYTSFYVPAADSFTEIRNPRCDRYIISGDNISGFIVTYVNAKDPNDEETETSETTETEPETTESTTIETTVETTETTTEETTIETTETTPIESTTDSVTTEYDPEYETLPGDNTYYPRRYSKYVTAASKKYNIPEHIIYAVIHTESAFQKNAVSKSGAKGLMQLMPKTFRWISDEMRFQYLPDEAIFDPQTNIDYGVWYLRYLYNYFGDWNSVFAAYNGGMGNVNKWLNDERYSENGKLIIDKIPLEETRNYVKKVNSSIATYDRLYGAPEEPEQTEND